jgi:uncharacterized protein (TIGR03382 family)
LTSGALSSAIYRNPQTEVLGGYDDESSFGLLIRGAGDLNGDGYDEVIVGDPYLGGRGYHWVFNGSASGPSADEDLLIEGAYGSEEWYPNMVAGDLDGDGYGDLVFGELGLISGSQHTFALHWGSASGITESPDSFTTGILYWRGDHSYPTDALVLCDVDGDGASEVVGVDISQRVAVLETSSAGVDTSFTTTTPGSVRDIDSLDCAGDVDGDGYEDVILGDYDNERVELMSGSSSGLSTSWTQSSSSGVAKYGSQVVGVGDVDGDGYDDVAVGHKAYGYVELFLGTSAGLGSSPDQTYVGSLAGHSQQIAALGDVDGDGVDDLGLLEPNYGVYGSKALGQVTLHLGASGGPSTTADASYQGDPSVGIDALAGVGDVNGDGYQDLGIGAEGAFGGVLTGASSPTLTLDFEWEPEDWYDDLGDSLAGGDFDGDGIGDLVYALEQGDLGVSFGSSAGIGQTPDDILLASDLGVSSQTGDLFGPGDLDGDGYDDLLIFDEDTLLVVYGGSTFGATTQTFSSTVPAIDSWLYQRGRKAQAGDFDGDGNLDVAYNEDHGTKKGKVSVRLGSSSGLGSVAWSVSGSAQKQELATDLTVADFDADGYDDLLMVADRYGTTLGTTGTALYLYTGSAAGLSSSPTLLDAGNLCDFLEAVGDIDGDGYPDAVCAGSGNVMRVFQGGAGGVTVGGAGPTPRMYHAVVGVVPLGDLEGDGFADFGLAPYLTGDLDIYSGSSSSPAFTLDNDLWSYVGDVVANQDLDGDGLVDLALAIFGTSTERGRIQVFPGGVDADGDGYVAGEDCDDSDASLITFTWYLDSDGDGYGDAAMGTTTGCTAPSGYVSDSMDCDDDDAELNPGSIWYLDGDSDGYGVSSSALTQCERPDGYSSESGDCDDSDALISPVATEICDGAQTDEDCDGLADNEDPEGAQGAVAFYADTDSDGYGDPEALGWLCTEASGFVSDDSDCDDARSDVNPAGTEVCDSQDTDEDCDGQADDLDPEGADGTSVFYRDEDGDAYGTPDSSAFCEISEGWAAETGDCDDGDGSIFPGAPEILKDGIDQDCDGEDQRRQGCSSVPEQSAPMFWVLGAAVLLLRRRRRSS